MTQGNNIRFVALGDSYTICEGAQIEESWPYLLTQHLKEWGVDIELVANPSVTGWTTQQLIDNELPIFDAAYANFVTLLIGVNDWVQEVSIADFEARFLHIVNYVLDKLENKRNLVLITIPDFGVTPNGANYGKGRVIADGIASFNAIIAHHSQRLNLPLVDIFPTTQQMLGQPDLVSLDGLHPSAKEYALWEKLIFEVVKRHFNLQAT